MILKFVKSANNFLILKGTGKMASNTTTSVGIGMGCAKAIVENVKRLLRKIYHLEKSIDAAMKNEQGYKNKLYNAVKYDGQILQFVEDFEKRITKEAIELLHPMQEVKHPLKNLSEDDMNQKVEFIENQISEPHDIIICRNCNWFGNNEKCPQRDPDHVSCPTAEPIVNGPLNQAEIGYVESTIRNISKDESPGVIDTDAAHRQVD